METIIPKEILERMNSKDNLVEDIPFEEQATPATAGPREFANAGHQNRSDDAEYTQADPLQYQELDPAQAYLEDLEYQEEHGGENGGESAGLDEEDVHDLADLVVDAVHASKDFLRRYFNSAFRKELKATFKEDEYKYLSIIRFCDQQGDLTMKSLNEALQNAKELDAKYKNLDFGELMDMAVTYKELKADYQPSPVKEYQERGIKKYSVKVIRKYFGEVKPDPLAMLILYMAVTFGGDAFRIWWNLRKKTEEG